MESTEFIPPLPVKPVRQKSLTSRGKPSLDKGQCFEILNAVGCRTSLKIVLLLHSARSRFPLSQQFIFYKHT